MIIIVPPVSCISMTILTVKVYALNDILKAIPPYLLKDTIKDGYIYSSMEH
jgi:hypothetical protein